MMRRALLLWLTLTMAVTPSFAGACALDCGTAADAAVSHEMHAQGAEPSDCHGHETSSGDDPADPTAPDRASMMAACAFAASAAAPLASLPAAAAAPGELTRLQPIFPTSQPDTPPDEPPRA